MPGGGEIAVNLNTAKGQLSLNAKTAGAYGLWVNRIDDKGEQSFGHDNIVLNSGDTAYLDYAKWGGDKAAMSLEIDRGSDGSIDETIDLSDDN